MKIVATVEESIMVEAYKSMRKVAKAKGATEDKKSEAMTKIFRDSMEVLDKLNCK